MRHPAGAVAGRVPRAARPAPAAAGPPGAALEAARLAL